MRRAIAVILAILAAGLLYVFVWPTPYVWLTVTERSGEQMPVRVNRWTGKMRVPTPEGWRE